MIYNPPILKWSNSTTLKPGRKPISNKTLPAEAVSQTQKSVPPPHRMEKQRKTRFLFQYRHGYSPAIPARSVLNGRSRQGNPPHRRPRISGELFKRICQRGIAFQLCGDGDFIKWNLNIAKTFHINHRDGIRFPEPISSFVYMIMSVIPAGFQLKDSVRQGADKSSLF